jgi:hypothetical protein
MRHMFHQQRDGSKGTLGIEINHLTETGGRSWLLSNWQPSDWVT